MMSSTKNCRGAWQSPHILRELRGHNPESFGVVPLTAKDRPSLLWKNRCSDVKPEEESPQPREVTSRDLELERHTEDFMCHTNTRQRKRILRAKVEAALRVDECDLEMRRHRLRCLLAEEDASYLWQVSEQEVKAEDRAAEMKEKLKRLKSKKEAERMRLVQEKLMQQLVSQNDSLRTKQSESLTKRTAQDRLVQMRDKELRREADRQEERLWAELQCADTRAKEHKEELQELERLEKESLTACALRRQMEEKEKKRMTVDERKKEEQLERLHQAELIEQEREEELREKHEKREELRQIYERGIQERHAVLAREVLEQDVFDLGHLERLFTTQSEQAKERQRRKLELLREQQLYKEYVRSDRAGRERGEREIDRLCAEEIERVNREKDEEMRKRKEASDQLLAECVNNHLLQKAEKEEHKAKEAETNLRQVAARLKKAKEEEFIEAEEKARERETHLRYGQELSNQVYYNHGLKDGEKKELDRMFALGLEAEAELECKTREITEGFSIGKLHPLLKREISRKGALPDIKITPLDPILRRDRSIKPCRYLGRPRDTNDKPSSLCQKPQ